MTVSKGDTVDHTDYTDLLDRVNVILGNGSGQLGYGQRVPSAETYITLDTGADIAHTEWNALKTDINKCSQHQSSNNAISATLAAGNIIGADASGTSVTRISGDDFSIDSPDASKGVNDWVAAVTTIETNAGAIDQFTETTGRAFVNTTRTTSWGVTNPTIYTQISIQFGGGYTVTNTDGTTSTATGADHRRHFFNAGGDIRITMFLNGSTAKDTDWGTMLGNSGTVIFGKNATTSTGTGRARDGSTDVDGSGGIDSAVGNYQLTTGNQLIFKKNGSQAEYAENYVEIYARRNVSQDTITFLIEFTDADVGDQRPREPGAGDPAGPGVDEPVLQFGGSMGCGMDLKRPTGSFVSLPEPTATVDVELRLT